MIITIIIIFVLVLTFMNTFSPSLSTLRDDIFLRQDTDSQVETIVPEEQSITPYTPQTSTPDQTSTSETSASETQTLEITTKIVSGPEHNEVIDETNQITFEFDLKIPNPDERTKFETKVEGFENDWQSTSSKERTITLPPGPKEYTFLVREKEKAETTSPAQRTFKLNISPYFQKVEIDDARLETSYYASLITLDTHLQQEEKIKITGWSIEGRGGSIMIITGIEKYRPAYNLVADELIFVERGDKVYLSKDLNPLGKDINFRPNECFGYLARDTTFPIQVPTTCPKPTKQEISSLDYYCQNFIEEMSTCEIIDYTLPFYDDCKVYLRETFNYKDCFDKHFNNEDFLENEWHIYVDRDILITGCDILYLRDQNGLFVDKYSYSKADCHW